MTQSTAGTRPRRRSSDAWSATSSVEWIGAGGVTLGRTPDTTDAPDGAVKAKVHYRYRGASKKPTFHAPDLVTQVKAFQTRLQLAHAEQWPADNTGRPVPPQGVPTLVAGRTNTSATDDSEALAGPVDQPTAPPALLLPSAPAGEHSGDVAWLVAWMKNRHETSKHKRTGKPLTAKTKTGYRNELDFFLSLARYEPTDPRCGNGVAPGEPWRVDDPQSRVTERDLLRALATRASTNLRVRESNQAAMEAWGRQVQDELQQAALVGREVELPPAPQLRPEEAGARTVESFARTVKEMFHDAQAYGLIDYQPWTARVQEEVPQAAATCYFERIVPSRAQVDMLRRTICHVTLTVRTPSGVLVTGSGGRYAAMVWLAGREGTRPEEIIAIRDSWVLLDDDDPRIVLQWADEPREGGRRRIQVPLKHRSEGQVRVLRPRPEDAEEFVAVLSEHRRKFVRTDAAGASNDGAADPDPYFFANHSEGPIELSNFGRWWEATLAAIPTQHRTPVFDGLPFRRLRAAAITDWLMITHNFSTEEAASKAGNSQQVTRAPVATCGTERPGRVGRSGTQDRALCTVRPQASAADARARVLAEGAA